MATIAGTVNGVQILQKSWSGVGARSVALLTVDFGAYTGASDDATITGLDALIQNQTRNGKTVTIRGGVCAFPGKDTNDQAVYTGAIAASGGTALTFNLAVAAGTEITAATASKGVGVMVAYDEA